MNGTSSSDHYVDDISGRPLLTDLVAQAREAEMQKFRDHKVYSKVPISDCIRLTGKQPIGSKWIDINKGDAKTPNYQSRLVAKEIKRGPSDEMFAATQPLEATKCLFSLPMSQLATGSGEFTAETQKLLFVDVRRAYFYAPARRPVFVKLPKEDNEPGMCGRLNVSMYGTRDAAANWKECYAQQLIANGFIQGKSSPCVCHHPARKIRCVEHGDDFTFLGCDDQLAVCEQMMKDQYEVKVRGKLGPDAKDDKVITILNRCLEWQADGIHYESDPRHAEILIRDLKITAAKAVATTGIKLPVISDEEHQFLPPEETTGFRKRIARCNLISQDRPDVQYAVKEITRGTANPDTTKYGEIDPLRQVLGQRAKICHCLWQTKKTFMQFTLLVTGILLERSRLAYQLQVGFATLALIP